MVYGLYTLRVLRIWGSSRISNTNKTQVLQSRIVHRVTFVASIYICIYCNILYKDLRNVSEVAKLYNAKDLEIVYDHFWSVWSSDSVCGTLDRSCVFFFNVYFYLSPITIKRFLAELSTRRICTPFIHNRGTDTSVIFLWYGRRTVFILYGLYTLFFYK